MFTHQHQTMSDGALKSPHLLHLIHFISIFHAFPQTHLPSPHHCRTRPDKRSGVARTSLLPRKHSRWILANCLFEVFKSACLPCALPLLWKGMIIRLGVVETGLYEVGKLLQRGLAYRGRDVWLELQKHHLLSLLIDKKHQSQSI